MQRHRHAAQRSHRRRLIRIFTRAPAAAAAAAAAAGRSTIGGNERALGMAVDERKNMQLKPQNLLINLPLAQRS
jgi:hypothetical protein